jgi:O-antigen/teichoic acid export membrane protein
MFLKNMGSMSVVSIYRAGTQFLISLVAAAYVSPAEYGLVALALPFTAFMVLLTDLGLTSALVRHPDLTPRNAGAAFSLIVSFGFALAVLLSLGTFVVTRHIDLPGFFPIMTALAFSSGLSLVAIVPRAMMERALRYPRVARNEMIAVLAATLVGVGCLVLGGGIWGLVTYMVLTQAIRAGLLWQDARAGIALNLQWTAIAPVLHFGGWVLASNLLNFLSRNADNVLVGSFLGTESLGLYSLAYQFMIVPLVTISWPAGAVLIATVSGRVYDARRTRETTGALLMVTSLITFPGMMYCTFGLALPISTFFAPRWIAVLPIISSLAVVGAIQSVAAYNGPLLLARGKAKLQLFVGVLNSLAMLTAFFVSVKYGLMTLVAVYTAVAVAASLSMIVLLSIEAGMGVLGFLRYLTPALLGTTCGLSLVHYLIGQPTSLTSWLIATIGYAVTVFSIYALFHRTVRQQFSELMRIERSPNLAGAH